MSRIEVVEQSETENWSEKLVATSDVRCVCTYVWLIWSNECNTSDYGIGGVLFQVVNDEWKPIAFISKSQSASQINWSTIQKEAYAIFYCCQQLDYLIRDRKFTIHTDHMNLTYMKQKPTSMVARWFIAMQELDFTVHFVKGSDNDALSRLCPNLTEIALPMTIIRDVLSSSSSSSSTSVAVMVQDLVPHSYPP